MDDLHSVATLIPSGVGVIALVLGKALPFKRWAPSASGAFPGFCTWLQRRSFREGIILKGPYLSAILD